MRLFETPSLDIVKISIEDIVTTSGEPLPLPPDVNNIGDCIS